MKCPRCHTDNPDNARFCFNCGNALMIHCTNCGTELPANARFCSNCGQPVKVSTPVDEVRLTHLAAATPTHLAEKMRGARMTGERKVVTAVFADVVGSTVLAEQMDAEEWTAIMNHAFDRFTQVIYHYEGTIARLLGDAILAFFGAPVAHEDDPVRAVSAALGLIAAAQQYSEEVRAKYGIDFAIRVGINTGPVVVGDVGSDLKYEYTAMGDAVNLAARMQSAARPMNALISANTYRFIAPLFEVRDLGMIEVKGKSEPVRVYEVLEAKAQPGRMRGLTGLESPMVGRDAELAVLCQLSLGIQTANGRAVVISGEAGLGKTRLVSEWKAVSTGESKGGASPVQWVEGHCLSYGQGLAYHLLIDVLRAMIGVTNVAGEPEVRAALQAYVVAHFGESAIDIYPYLGHLLSLQLDGAAAERVKMLDPQSLQMQYLIALRRTLMALASRQPLVLILDDIHWVDPSSADLLAKLLPLTSEAPILFCFITRPDQDTAGWGLINAARESLGANLTVISLNPLSDADSRHLVSNLLEIESLPDRIRTVILQKAEGNPFFVEEVIRMLIDRGAIVRRGNSWAAGKTIDTIEIPDNLQGLLLARIDRLPEDVKRTLRVASVIGRQFSVQVLEQVLATN